MVVLVGYSVAGRRIVVVVRSGRMSLSGNRVSLQVRATIVASQAVTRREAVSLSRALKESGTVDTGILCYCELPEL